MPKHSTVFGNIAWQSSQRAGFACLTESHLSLSRFVRENRPKRRGIPPELLIEPEKSSPCEIIEKKSRFIGFAKRVATEEEAKAFIEKVRLEHRKSRHIAFAYVLSNTAKTNDDGEPKGTAGLPIYNTIIRRELQNVVVVVVRYFGGILLGKGGLIRAYGRAAGLALEHLRD
ncbi:MAG: YigZ family protein [Oscillospiraceae bacterium]|nr:YigZ family protein [Oscillospiraceae bacterium]